MGLVESLTQKEYNALYDNLSNYALYRAKSYYNDDSLAYEAADAAMDRFVHALLSLPDIKNLEAWGKTIIGNSLKNSARDRKLEPIPIAGEDYHGYHSYEVL